LLVGSEPEAKHLAPDWLAPVRRSLAAVGRQAREPATGERRKRPSHRRFRSAAVWR